MTNEKPRFEEIVPATTMNLPDDGLKFNAKRVELRTFAGLRDSENPSPYGKGFRMPTVSECVSLLYASLENKREYKTAKNVVKTLKYRWITGNTGILYVPEGMFVQDNPELDRGEIVMDQRELEKKLGSHEETGVKFSKDRRIRFTPYDFEKRSQTPLKLSTNKGIIALVGGEKNAGKFAKASEHWKKKPYFQILENVNSPQIRTVVLYSNLLGGGIGVNADFNEGFDKRFSFGVQKIKQKKEE
jgi:hypothetical protein